MIRPPCHYTHDEPGALSTCKGGLKGTRLNSKLLRETISIVIRVQMHMDPKLSHMHRLTVWYEFVIRNVKSTATALSNVGRSSAKSGGGKGRLV